MKQLKAAIHVLFLMGGLLSKTCVAGPEIGVVGMSSDAVAGVLKARFQEEEGSFYLIKDIVREGVERREQLLLVVPRNGTRAAGFILAHTSGRGLVVANVADIAIRNGKLTLVEMVSGGVETNQQIQSELDEITRESSFTLTFDFGAMLRDQHLR